MKLAKVRVRYIQIIFSKFAKVRQKIISRGVKLAKVRVRYIQIIFRVDKSAKVHIL